MTGAVGALLRGTLPVWALPALTALVEHESPSEEPERTAACLQRTAQLAGEHLGSGVPRWCTVDGRQHLQLDFGSPRVLLVGHLDTVWPAGTLARWPFAVRGDVATGPGVFDMKAGVVQGLVALAALRADGDLDGVRLLLTTDEELGSPTSAGVVAEAARGLAAALVLEPSAAGALKTARKGIGQFALVARGRAAHAGLEPEKGANAGLALSHAVIAAAALGDPAAGTSVTPTLLAAGTTANTVPAHGRVAVDVRAGDAAEFDRVSRGLAAAATAAGAHVAGVQVTVEGGVNRPALPASSSAALFAAAQALAAGWGWPALAGVAVGGGSDGNITAAAGVPTLDGLGAVGDHAHGEGEYALLSAMAPRAALVAALVRHARGPVRTRHG